MTVEPEDQHPGRDHLATLVSRRLRTAAVHGRRVAAFLTVAVAAVLLAAGGCAPASPGLSTGQQTAGASRTAPAVPGVAPGVVAPGVVAAGVAADGGAGWVRRENARTGSTAWRIKAAAVARDTQLAGYADHVSIRPGEPLHLYVTTTAALLHRQGLPARLVRRRPRPPGVDLPGAARNRAARTDHRRPPHRHHPLAPVGDPGHARLAGGHLPAAADRQPRAWASSSPSPSARARCAGAWC